MAKNTNGRNMIFVLLAALAALVLFNCMNPGPKTSGYMLRPAPVQAEGVAQERMTDVCALKNGGTGLASALLPKEVATQEDFGKFAPDDILKGQNFLNPRDQIGFPETIGGTLRNANQQVRSEPPNPRAPVTIFNTSTIAPDQMRPSFEIGSGLA